MAPHCLQNNPKFSSQMKCLMLEPLPPPTSSLVRLPASLRSNQQCHTAGDVLDTQATLGHSVLSHTISSPGVPLTSIGCLANPHRRSKPLLITPQLGRIQCQLPLKPLPPCWVVPWAIWWLGGSGVRKTWVWIVPLPSTSCDPMGQSLNFSFFSYTIPTSQRDCRN